MAELVEQIAALKASLAERDAREKEREERRRKLDEERNLERKKLEENLKNLSDLVARQVSANLESAFAAPSSTTSSSPTLSSSPTPSIDKPSIGIFTSTVEVQGAGETVNDQKRTVPEPSIVVCPQNTIPVVQATYETAPPPESKLAVSLVTKSDSLEKIVKESILALPSGSTVIVHVDWYPWQAPKEGDAKTKYSVQPKPGDKILFLVLGVPYYNVEALAQPETNPTPFPWLYRAIAINVPAVGAFTPSLIQLFERDDIFKIGKGIKNVALKLRKDWNADFVYRGLIDLQEAIAKSNLPPLKPDRPEGRVVLVRDIAREYFNLVVHRAEKESSQKEWPSRLSLSYMTRCAWVAHLFLGEVIKGAISTEEFGGALTIVVEASNKSSSSSASSSKSTSSRSSSQNSKAKHSSTLKEKPFTAKTFDNPKLHTKPCHRWAQGICQYGDSCKFSHGNVCKYWQAGTCFKGDGCLFSHPKHLAPTQQITVPFKGKNKSDKRNQRYQAPLDPEPFRYEPALMDRPLTPPLPYPSISPSYTPTSTPIDPLYLPPMDTASYPESIETYPSLPLPSYEKKSSRSTTSASLASSRRSNAYDQQTTYEDDYTSRHSNRTSKKSSTPTGAKEYYYDYYTQTAPVPGTDYTPASKKRNKSNNSGNQYGNKRQQTEKKPRYTPTPTTSAQPDWPY